MKHILVLLFFYTLCGQAYNASLVQNDSTTFSTKATEGISKLVYAFMEDYKSTLENYRESEIDLNEKKGMELFKSKFIDGFDSSSDLLDRIDSFLANKANGWSDQGYNVFKALRENYEREINFVSYDLMAVLEIDDITKIYIQEHNQNKNDKIHWNEISNSFFITGSKSNNEEVIKTQFDSNEAEQNNRSNSIYRDEAQPEENNFDFYSYGIYLGVFVIGFLCAIIFFNFKIKKLIGEKYYDYKRLYRNKYRGLSLIHFDVIKILKERKEHYQKEAEPKPIYTPSTVMTKRASTWGQREYESSQQHKKSTQNIEETIPVEKAQVFDLDVSSNQDTHRSVGSEKRIIALYFSAPDQSGSFSLENSSSAATSRSYYKVEYVEGENIGKLIYRSGNLDLSALSQMDYILSPVCDIENSSMTNPSAIYVESDGSVIKEDDFWRIKEKIKVKLS